MKETEMAIEKEVWQRPELQVILLHTTEGGIWSGFLEATRPDYGTGS